MGSPPTPTDWSWWGHVTYFWNFWTSSLSRERFELQTSNLACRLVTGDTNNKNEKLGQKAGKGSRDATFEILGPRAGFTQRPLFRKKCGNPSLSREWFELETTLLYENDTNSDSALTLFNWNWFQHYTAVALYVCDRHVFPFYLRKRRCGLFVNKHRMLAASVKIVYACCAWFSVLKLKFWFSAAA